jgi:acyl dehydratase
MVDRRERLWTFDAVEPGQIGNETTVEITSGNIAEYARLSLNHSPAYQSGSSELVAMPTMVLSYAPLLREEIASANGFVAFEVSKSNRSQTPFAKCEIRWFIPVTDGDIIVGRRRVLEKYERRGSKFVTFRVEAINQRKELVSEYDYTCIFEYAQGQREVPRLDANQVVDATPLLGSQGLINFTETSIGHHLNELAITESQKIMNEKNDFRLAGRRSDSNIHTDEEFAKQNIFAGTTNSGPATMSYVDQMLGLSFPVSSFYSGGSLLMRAITPFRSGDTVTFRGEITDKREDGGKNLIYCRVKGTNQRGDLVCLSDGSFVLS